MVYDINLLPKSKKNASGAFGFWMLFMGILCAAALIVFFFMFPLQQKILLMKKIQKQEEQLASYATVEEEYDALTAAVKDLNRRVTAIDRLRESKLLISIMLNDLEKSIPRNITASSITLEEGMLTIIGEASTYKEMAQFIVNLRALEKVEAVTFTNAIKQTSNSPESAKDKTRYNFTIYVRCAYHDILAEAQTIEAAQEVQ